MAKMNQPGMDKGEKGESGEKFPKGAAKADLSGERKTGIKNGVGMGTKDDTGGRAAGSPDLGEINTGRGSEAPFYNHKRIPHDQDK